MIIEYLWTKWLKLNRITWLAVRTWWRVRRKSVRTTAAIRWSPSPAPKKEKLSWRFKSTFNILISIVIFPPNVSKMKSGKKNCKNCIKMEKKWVRQPLVIKLPNPFFFKKKVNFFKQCKFWPNWVRQPKLSGRWIHF